MRLGSKVDHRTRLVGLQQLVDQSAVANIAFDKHMARVTRPAGQIAQVARIGQGVQVDHGLVGLPQAMVNKIATNEAGTAGHQNRHGFPWLCAFLAL